MRAKFLAGAIAGGLALMASGAHDARACGGCFVRPRPTSQVGTVVTDHRMIFALSAAQTTLYDQIQYSGDPQEFAWVLPIQGQVTLGVSSDQLFATLDQATQATILAPPYPCPTCNCSSAGRGGFPGGGGASTAPVDNVADAGVVVLAQQVVGPYDTVQLHPTSTSDTAALTAWLQANSYTIPPSIDPVIAAYVNEGFDFLAVKLVPGQGVQAMRPISVTTPGGALSLPLRMVAAGTGATVGITLWVVSDGRYEPMNFPSFTINPTDLVWDWSVGDSNYTTLRAQKEQSLNNGAWQIESSLDLSPYAIEKPVLADPMASSYTAVPAQDGGVGISAIQARSQDLNTLFPTGGSSVRITRMRGDLAQAALATDLVLQAAADQSSLSNVYQVTESTNANCTACGCGSSSGGSTPFGGVGPGGSGGSVVGGVAGGGGTNAGNGGSGANGPAAGASPMGGNTRPGAAGASGSHGGCSASSSEPPGIAFILGLAAMGAGALARARRRRSR